MDVSGYTYADYARNILDRMATVGYLTLVEGNRVTWKSKKQNMVARSSVEAEYIGIEFAHKSVQNEAYRITRSVIKGVEI